MTETTVDRATHTLTFRRALGGSPTEAWDAWTDPAKVATWWDPTGLPLAACDIDLRPGGAFRFENASAHSHPFTGVYKVIDPPHRLVFDALGAEGTVRLDAGADGTTRMTVTIRCASAEHLEQFVARGVADGTARTLDNLGARWAAVG